MSESAIKSPDEVAQSANRLILDGDVGGALALLKSHMLQDPLASKLSDLVDSLLEGAGLIEFYRDLQKSAPEDWRLVVVLAAAYSRSGKDSLAVVQLQKLLRTDSDHPEVWMALAQCYRRLDKAELALRALNSLIDLQPNFPKAHVTRLLYLLDSGDLEEATAASIFSLEVKDLPAELLSWIDKVNLHLEQGKRPPEELLQEQEEKPVPKEPEPPAPAPEKATTQELSQREKTQQLLCFTNMLTIMVKGGLSFSRIFGILASKQCSLSSQVINELEKSVMRDGEPLSKALAHHPAIFSDQYLALVEMGESTNLSRCLDRLCEQLKLEYLRSEPKDDHRPALILSCRNLTDALEASGNEVQALAWAVRACADEKIRTAIQELEKQVASGIRLAECSFPALFTPLITSLVVAHDAVGTVPNAFKDLARLLTR